MDYANKEDFILGLREVEKLLKDEPNDAVIALENTHDGEFFFKGTVSELKNKINAALNKQLS